jgi:hypothetical protein
VVVGKISCIPRVENSISHSFLKPRAYGLWLNSANSCEIFHFQLLIYNILYYGLWRNQEQGISESYDVTVSNSDFCKLSEVSLSLFYGLSLTKI